MKLGKASRILAGSAAGGLLFCLLTVLFIPGSALLQAANGALSGYGLRLDAASFGKALPVGISGRGITLSAASGELLKLDRGRIALEILPLFAGRLSVAITAEVGAGRLDATLSLRRAPAARIELKNVRLEDIPFFRNAAGMKAAGILSGKVETTGLLARSKGYLQLEVQGAELSGIKLGEMPLPDASYRTVQGMIRINEGRAVIESFSLQGDDLYVRLKGGLPLVDPLPATQLDLTLELMPKPALLERQKLAFLLLLKFQDTPGHYRIPVKGTLGKPQVL
jgi:type II secretion system protein N